MTQLNDEKAREVLTDSLINFTQVAVEYYGADNDNPARSDADKAKALRNITLRSNRMTKKTLERLSIVLCRLYEKMSDEVIL